MDRTSLSLGHKPNSISTSIRPVWWQSVDDSLLFQHEGVQALVRAGYPSQSGGPALLDVLLGRRSLAGRLPVTQYSASYAHAVSIFGINLRRNLNGSYPGRTYKRYTGKPVSRPGNYYTTRVTDLSPMPFDRTGVLRGIKSIAVTTKFTGLGWSSPIRYSV